CHAAVVERDDVIAGRDQRRHDLELPRDGWLPAPAHQHDGFTLPEGLARDRDLTEVDLHRGNPMARREPARRPALSVDRKCGGTRRRGERGYLCASQEWGGGFRVARRSTQFEPSGKGLPFRSSP